MIEDALPQSEAKKKACFINHLKERISVLSKYYNSTGPDKSTTCQLSLYGIHMHPGGLLATLDSPQAQPCPVLLQKAASLLTLCKAQ